jgi:hypothetical protein
MRVLRLISACFLLSLFLGSFESGAHAQTQITLGNATTALGGPWKFRTGDNLAWAQVDFDDSAWGTMDLTLPPGSFDPVLGSKGYLPRWTARGYKGYSGYAWYRLKTNVQDGQTRLAIKLPDDVNDGYQVYVNGQYVGEFGRFTARGVTLYNTEPQAFLLPENFRGGQVTFAVRMFMGAFTPLVDVGAIRNQAETSLEPLSLLQSLNRRLLGRGQANATCLALRNASDGLVTLANAGHLPPYVNGREMSMEGALLWERQRVRNLP